MNINTASVTVLASLPGMDPNSAQQVVNYRQSNPNNLGSIAWIVDALGRGSVAIQGLEGGDYITTRSFQFAADIAAVGPYGRGYRRVKFIFDISDGTARDPIPTGPHPSWLGARPGCPPDDDGQGGVMMDWRDWKSWKRQGHSSVLALSLDGDRLEGIVLRRTNGSLQALQSFSEALSLDPLTADSELVGREIRNHLDAAGVRERHCVVCVPLKWALVVHVELPRIARSGRGQLPANRGGTRVSKRYRHVAVGHLAVASAVRKAVRDHDWDS